MSNGATRVLVALALVVTVASWPRVATTQPAPRSVLILDQSSPGIGAFAEITTKIRETVGEARSRIVVYEERLDANRFRTPDYLQLIQQLIATKYRDVPIDLIIAIGPTALDFAVTMRSGQWAALPIVFAAVAPQLAQIDGAANVTGRTVQVSIADAATAARALVPGLKQLVLVGDRFEEQSYRRHFVEEFARLKSQLPLTDLTGQSLAMVKEKVSQLPNDAAVYFTTFNRDADGAAYTPRAVLREIATVSSRPIVVDVETYLGGGASGGYVVMPSVLGQEAAELAKRVLGGEAIASIPITASDAVRPVFDWRELRRWGVDEDTLPSGSEVRFRDSENWREYRWRAVLFAAGMLLQSVLIAWLLYADFRRRRAEENATLLAAELMHSNRVATAGQLTASLAHEIRQPLTAIVSSANAALNWLKRDPPDVGEVRDALENVVGQGHRADDVIKHMRTMFKKEPTDRTRCNVNELVREILGLATGRIAAGDVKLMTAYADPSPVVLADGVQLQQVILNLVVNAVEAMGHVPFGRRAVYVTTSVADRQALIVVEDTGPGMDEKTLTRIFDPFFTTKTGGMGMGLSICKSIIEAHGGTLTAWSQAGGGATFRILIPLHRGGKA